MTVSQTITDARVRVLFLCTGNSCRSQMAEGWMRELASDICDPCSAGIEAHGKNPRAILAMAEAGVDISRQESSRLEPEMLEAVDLVVTVCGHADEHCPALPPHVRRLHWPLSDPARATGSEEEVMVIFRACREEVRRRVVALAKELRDGSAGLVLDKSAHS